MRLSTSPQRQQQPPPEKLISKSKKKLQNNITTDFAPGQSHIVLKRNGINYYHPNIFHTSKTLRYQSDGKYFPLSIRDLLKVENCKDVYDALGRHPDSFHIILFDNHPLQKIRIMGKVIGERWQEFENDVGYGYGYNERNSRESKGYAERTTVTRTVSPNIQTKTIHLLDLNDGSSSSSVTVKLESLQYTMCGFNFEKNFDKLVQVDGMIKFYRGSITLVAESVRVMGSINDLMLEVNWWKQVMSVRKEYIAQPWVFKIEDKLSTRELIDEQTKKSKRVHYDINNVDVITIDDDDIDEDDEVQEIKYKLDYNEAQKERRLKKLKFNPRFEVPNMLDSVWIHRDKQESSPSPSPSMKPKDLSPLPTVTNDDIFTPTIPCGQNDVDPSVIVLSDSDDNYHNSNKVETSAKPPKESQQQQHTPNVAETAQELHFINQSPSFNSQKQSESRVPVQGTPEYFEDSMISNSIHVYSEEKYETEVITFILKQQKQKFPLLSLVEDSNLTKILTNLALTSFYNATINGSIDEASLTSKFQGFDVGVTKTEIFHRCRKRLIKCRLFDISKNKNIHAQNIFKIVHFVNKKIKHVCKKQQQEIESIIKDTAIISMRSSNAYMSILKAKLKNCHLFPIDVNHLNLSVSKLLNISEPLPNIYLNTIISQILLNEFNEPGIVGACQFQFQVEMSWVYNTCQDQWIHAWELKRMVDKTNLGDLSCEIRASQVCVSIDSNKENMVGLEVGNKLRLLR
ncbi:unnamed protein product [Ambrosiozyma monospora]|uniref:Unnamed protein product n=1 Tax=Ambrosiozyma monospora TaxID=43982 RepID=A0A9W7DGW2_AMBMO|nr:unnamed protein product [Ambrosiozyma monospora]